MLTHAFATLEATNGSYIPHMPQLFRVTCALSPATIPKANGPAGALVGAGSLWLLTRISAHPIPLFFLINPHSFSHFTGEYQIAQTRLVVVSAKSPFCCPSSHHQSTLVCWWWVLLH
jgi:hypothetical protein